MKERTTTSWRRQQRLLAVMLRSSRVRVWLIGIHGTNNFSNVAWIHSPKPDEKIFSMFGLKNLTISWNSVLNWFSCWNTVPSHEFCLHEPPAVPGCGRGKKCLDERGEFVEQQKHLSPLYSASAFKKRDLLATPNMKLSPLNQFPAVI